MPSQFEYLLNAMERAAQEEKPAEHGYAEKRRAVLDFVRDLEGRVERTLRPGTDRTKWPGHCQGCGASMSLGAVTHMAGCPMLGGR